MASDPLTPGEPTGPPFALEIALVAGDLQDDWRRCNMAANYLAEYVAYQFAEREWAENVVSTVANEVLEAVARLSPAAQPLTLHCRQAPNELLIEVEHGVRPELAASYAGFLGELGARDTGELYFELLTAAARPASAFNQFGLTMIVHDFGASVAGTPAATAGRHSLQIRVPNIEISG